MGCFGNRNFEQAYEIGRVVAVNSNGTLDVLIPGRAHPYSELPSLIDPRVHREGLVVIVGKAHGNPYLPFVLGDTRSYRRKVPSDFVPTVVIALYDWSSSRSNSRQNFVSGLPGPLIDISYGEDGDLIQTKMDLVTLNGQIIGILQYKLVIDEESGEEVQLLGIKNQKDGISTFGYRDEFYSYLPNTFINDSDDFIYESTVNDTTSSPRYDSPFSSYLYIPESGKLVLAKSGSSLRGQIIVIDAISGNIPGGTAALNGDVVTPYARFGKSYAVDQGLVNCGGVLVKTFHWHSFSHNHTTNITTENSMDDRKIQAFNLSGIDLWNWDVWKVFNGTTIPFRWEIVNHEYAGSSSGNWTFTTNNLFGIYPPKNLFLPGSNGVYLESIDCIVLAVPTRQVWNLDRIPYVPNNLADDANVNVTHAGQSYADGGPPLNQSSSAIYNGTLGGGSSISIDGGAIGSNIPGIFSNSKLITGWNYQFDSNTNAKSLKNYLVSLKVSDSNDADRIIWKYEFPELFANENYIVDQESFDRVNITNTRMAAFVTALTANLKTIYGSNSVVNFDFHSAICFPYQLAVSGYTYDGLVADWDYAIHGSYVDNLYWPNGANYYWDPMFITDTGDTKIFPDQNTNNTTSSGIVADIDDNIYGTYLKPFLILTCANIGAQIDQSLYPYNDSSWQSHNNGFESDRETLIVGDVSYQFVEEVHSPSNSTINTFNFHVYGRPSLRVFFKSFFGKWNSAGELQWQHELTTYMDDRIDNSSSLVGQLPYPGCTLRICPCSAGIFVLRAVRLPINTGVREFLLYNTTECVTYHTYNSKVVLELRDYETGLNIWDDEVVIYDPTSIAPSWVVGVNMMCSEDSRTGEPPYVVGRVDFSKEHSYKLRNLTASPDYSGGLARVSRIFTCTSEGTLVFRNVIDGTEDVDGNEYTDFGTCGLWPYDNVNTGSYRNGKIRAFNPILMDGKIHYAGEDDAKNKFSLFSYGDGIPPV